MRGLAGRLMPSFLLAGFAVLFLRDFLTHRKVLLHPDFYTLYYSFRHWFARRLAAGELPLWNPYWGLGHPAEAWGTIPLDLYTPLELAFGSRYEWFLLLQALALLGAATWVLGRLGFPPVLSAAGAILFLLSPWVSYFFLYFIHGHSFIVHVLLFLCAYRWLESSDRRWLAGIAATTALGMLGTKLDLWLVQGIHFVLLVAGGAILVHGRRLHAAIRAAAPALLAMLAGVAANAWQLAILLPTLAESGRARGAGTAALLSGRVYRDLALSLPESVPIQLAVTVALLWAALRARGRRAVAFTAAAVVVTAVCLTWERGDLPREPVANPSTAQSAATPGRGVAAGSIEMAPSSRDGTLAGLWRRFAADPVAAGAGLGLLLAVLALGDRDWRGHGRTSLLFLLFAYYYCRLARGDLGEVQVLHAAPAAFKLGLGAAVWLGCRQLGASRLARLAYLSVLIVLVMRDQGQILLAHVAGIQWVPTRDSYIVDWGFVVLAVTGLASIPGGAAAGLLATGAVRRGAGAVAALAVVLAAVISMRGDLTAVHPLVGPAPPGSPYFEGIASLRALLAGLRDGPTTRVLVANDEFMEFHHVMGSSLLEGVGQLSLYSSLGSARYRDWTILQRLGLRPEQGWRGWSNETTIGTARRLPRLHDLGFPNSEIYKHTVVNRPALARDPLELLGTRFALRLHPVDGPYRVEDRAPDPVEDSVRRLDPARVRLISGRVLGEGSGPMYLAELSHPLPRAFVLQAIGGAAEAELRRELRPRVEPEAVATDASRFPLTAARITRYEPERVDVEVEAPAGGVLVLSDLYHPFWRATVDGQLAEIFPVFSVLRGVRVGAGRHAVTFVCRVPGLGAAWVISAAAVLVIGLGWWGARRGAGSGRGARAEP